MNNPLLSPPTSPDLVTAQLSVAVGQIEFARAYVLELLAATPPALWGTMPAGATSTIAWQVGHLTVSQYGLLMFRQRGREPDDLDLVPGVFRKKYGRGSQPVAEADDPGSDSAPGSELLAEQLMQRLNRVHEAALEVIQSSPVERLLEPIDMPYAVYPNKLGAILFCPLHEQLHAGQIGTLRRMLGLESVR